MHDPDSPSFSHHRFSLISNMHTLLILPITHNFYIPSNARCGHSCPTKCKGDIHLGMCPEDEALELLKGTAAREGWR
jgi:hypothetical protein